ncbi:MAG: hypothetical protein JKY65_00770 [Planctomycetes bacterium]|nr:hypothetical protein [Planctomycetota bacterium]
MRVLLLGALLSLACVGCRQEEPAASPGSAAVEVGFREEEYLLEMYDVADLLHESSGEAPSCLVEADLVAPSKALDSDALLAMIKQVVGPAGESEFALFEVHRRILLARVPGPEQALIQSLVRNLRRNTSIFVEFSVVELSEEETRAMSHTLAEGLAGVATYPQIREQLEALRATQGAPAERKITLAASAWGCLPLSRSKTRSAPFHGLHVNAQPSSDRRRLGIQLVWGLGTGDLLSSVPLQVRDRSVFLILVPLPHPNGPFALAIQPRLVALDPIPASGPGPRIQVKDD